MGTHCFSIVLFTSGSAVLQRQYVVERGFLSCTANRRASKSDVIFIVHVFKISVVLSIESIKSLCRVTFVMKASTQI